MRKIVRLLCAMTAAAAVTLAGCAQNAAEQEEITPVKVPVETMKVSSASIQSDMVYAGQTTPLSSVSVTGKMAGKVLETYFEPGDWVQAGEVLYILDKKDIENQIKQLESQLNAASQGVRTAEYTLQTVTGGQYESQKLQLQAAVDSAVKQVENAELTLSRALETLDNTETTYNNTKTLYEAGVATKANFDQASLAYEQAQKGVSQAEIGLSSAQLSLTQAESGLALATGDIVSESAKRAELGVSQAAAARQSAQVQLDIARETLADLEVTSPVSGTVSVKNVKANEMYGMQAPAYTIIDDSSVIVKVRISELLINAVSAGETVDVTVGAVSKEPMAGVITSMSPAADQTSTFPVEITIPNPAGSIKAGMFAEARFLREYSENTVVLPRNTVLEDETETYVFVNDGGTARKVTVTTGIDNGESVEVTSGLSFGDEVIVTGQTFVMDGDGINVVGTLNEGA